jgi:hypothetical protein
MKTLEGTIRFDLRFEPAAPLRAEEIREINAWRKILYALELIGQDPARYNGFGYGNISMRLPPEDTPAHRRRFLITGTQTGAIANLAPHHYTTVIESDPKRNLIVARGPVKPSSEALTHAAVYALNKRIRFVVHVHSREIWGCAKALGIPLTRNDATYGTPLMAMEMRRVLKNRAARTHGILAMGGHEDGLVSFGRTGEGAVGILISSLAKALEILAP